MLGSDLSVDLGGDQAKECFILGRGCGVLEPSSHQGHWCRIVWTSVHMMSCREIRSRTKIWTPWDPRMYVWVVEVLWVWLRRRQAGSLALLWFPSPVRMRLVNIKEGDHRVDTLRVSGGF